MPDYVNETQELIKRLRNNKVTLGHGEYGVDPLCELAADEIDRLCKEVKRLHDVAIFLFDLLDDIDTASDEAKNNHEWYRKRVEHIQRRRFEVMETDGYNVKVK